MPTLNSKWWGQHPMEMPNGKPTNAYFEYTARKYFEKYCAIIGVEPYHEVAFESAADLPGHAVGMGGRDRVQINFNWLRKHSQYIPEVVAHEVAHCWQKRNTCERKPHGPQWAAKLESWGFTAHCNLSK